MLVPSCVLPESLLEGDWTDIAAAMSHHRQAVGRLRDCARLVLVNEKHRSSLLEALELLPQPARTLWSAALQDLLPRAGDLKASPDEASVEACAGVAEVVAVTREVLEAKGESSTGVLEDSATGLELVRLECLPLSERLVAADRLQDADVREGEHRDDVWRRRLQPLALVSAQMYVVDQYAHTSVLAGKGAGVHWLFKHLGQMQTKLQRLEVMLGDTGTDVVDAARDLVQETRPAQQVYLTPVPSSRFSSESHSRHLRFVAAQPSSRKWAILLDKGIEPLNDTKARRSWPCLRGDEPSARAREGALRNGNESIKLL